MFLRALQTGCLATFGCLISLAQTPATQGGTLTVRSSLVVVPALVKTAAGERVFSLRAADFQLSDDGVPQIVHLEEDTDALPLALAVVVQTGGAGVRHLRDYQGLDAVLDAVIGGVPHHVAVISFDSTPHTEQPFTPSTETAAATLNGLQPGDGGACILDALRFAVDLLRQEPPTYRRAVLLFSETVDSGSSTPLDEALRALDDTNTSIYTFAFSSTGAAVKHEAAKLPRPGGSAYSSTPYKAGGCMSREADADPDAHGSRAVQAMDCAEDLLPPLRLAHMAFLAAEKGSRRNVPETVADLTGGEYFPFKDGKSLARGLITISNDVPNHYVLSFVPHTPHAGLHSLQLRVPGRTDVKVAARSAYWVDSLQ